MEAHPLFGKRCHISWDSWCTPKEAVGLDLRKISPWNQVLGLKILWIIFVASCSLWVSWIRRNFIGDANFRTLDVISNGSWIWKCICKMWTIVSHLLPVKWVLGLQQVSGSIIGLLYELSWMLHVLVVLPSRTSTQYSYVCRRFLVARGY